MHAPTPLQPIIDEKTDRAGVAVFLKRDDLGHDLIPGNKYRKLKYNLAAAREQGHSRIVAFGGAYSNLLPSVAIMGKQNGLLTRGIVRGDKHEPLNSPLQVCEDYGMELAYIDRKRYRNKNTPEFIDYLHQTYGDFYLLPEGGSNALAVYGCAELVSEIDCRVDYIACSVGTGGMMAGIIYGSDDLTRVVGFSCLKGGGFLDDEVKQLLASAGKNHLKNWQIETDYHFGGYGKRQRKLDEFIDWFQMSHGLCLDWVYEAKMLFGVYSWLENGRFRRGSHVVAVIAGEDSQFRDYSHESISVDE